MLKQIHPGVIAAILTLLAIASATFGIVAYTLQWSIPLAVVVISLMLTILGVVGNLSWWFTLVFGINTITHFLVIVGHISGDNPEKEDTDDDNAEPVSYANVKTVKCHNCGGPNPNGAGNCAYCGSSL